MNILKSTCSNFWKLICRTRKFTHGLLYWLVVECDWSWHLNTEAYETCTPIRMGGLISILSSYLTNRYPSKDSLVPHSQHNFKHTYTQLDFTSAQYYCRRTKTFNFRVLYFFLFFLLFLKLIYLFLFIVLYDQENFRFS